MSSSRGREVKDDTAASSSHSRVKAAPSISHESFDRRIAFADARLDAVSKSIAGLSTHSEGSKSPSDHAKQCEGTRPASDISTRSEGRSSNKASLPRSGAPEKVANHTPTESLRYANQGEMKAETDEHLTESEVSGAGSGASTHATLGVDSRHPSVLSRHSVPTSRASSQGKPKVKGKGRQIDENPAKDETLLPLDAGWNFDAVSTKSGSDKSYQSQISSRSRKSNNQLPVTVV